MKKLALLLIWLGLTGFSHAVDKSNPNIILILADDMGPGEPRHMDGLIPTPALSQMKAEGMHFTDAHTTSSVCTPTRYGILTGRYNWRSRLKSGVLTNVNSPALMDPKRLNLGTFLQNSGYHTACIGKWHLGVDWEKNPDFKSTSKRPEKFASWAVDYTKSYRNGPTDVGFDEAFFILASLDMPPYLYLRNDRAVEVPTIDRGFPHNEYNDYERVGAAAEGFDPSECLADFAAESRKYIKERVADESEKPFFLYLPLNSPHTPVRPGKAFKGKYPQYSWYADFMAETDWVVGEVLAQLEESDIDANTMVIFTSDNGFAPYVKIPKMFAAGYRPSWEYRGAKATLFEGGHRVPFLVRWPKVISGGTKSDATICTTDFFATFAEVLGKQDEIPDNAAEDSFSFFPCFTTNTESIRPFTVHHGIGGEFSVRKGPWKLLLSTKVNGGWGDMPGQEDINTPAEKVQLYHLGNDHGERKNLEKEHPEKIEELVNDLAKAFADGRTTPGKPQSNEGWPIRNKAGAKGFEQLVEPAK